MGLRTPCSYIKRANFSSLSEAIYMACAEKQAYKMTFLEHRRMPLGRLGAICIFLALGGAVPCLGVMEGLFDAIPVVADSMTFYVLVRMSMVFAVLSLSGVGVVLLFINDLRRYTTLWGIVQKFISLILLEILSLVLLLIALICITLVIVCYSNGPVLDFVSRLPPSLLAIENWFWIPFVITWGLAIVFIGPFALVSNSDKVRAVGEIFSLVSIVLSLCLSPWLPSENGTLYPGYLIASFLLAPPVAMFVVASLKDQWKKTYFFGNDINESRVFVVPSIRHPEMYEPVEARFFLRKDERGCYEKGSVLKNIMTYVKERRAQRQRRSC